MPAPQDNPIQRIDDRPSYAEMVVEIERLRAKFRANKRKAQLELERQRMVVAATIGANRQLIAASASCIWSSRLLLASLSHLR